MNRLYRRVATGRLVENVGLFVETGYNGFHYCFEIIGSVVQYYAGPQ
jgi:hypothetical protein